MVTTAYKDGDTLPKDLTKIIYRYIEDQFFDRDWVFCSIWTLLHFLKLLAHYFQNGKQSEKDASIQSFLDLFPHMFSDECFVALLRILLTVLVKSYSAK